MAPHHKAGDLVAVVEGGGRVRIKRRVYGTTVCTIEPTQLEDWARAILLAVKRRGYKLGTSSHKHSTIVVEHPVGTTVHDVLTGKPCKVVGWDARHGKWDGETYGAIVIAYKTDSDHVGGLRHPWELSKLGTSNPSTRP